MSARLNRDAATLSTKSTRFNMCVPSRQLGFTRWHGSSEPRRLASLSKPSSPSTCGWRWGYSEHAQCGQGWEDLGGTRDDVQIKQQRHSYSGVLLPAGNARGWGYLLLMKVCESWLLVPNVKWHFFFPHQEALFLRNQKDGISRWQI